jgi:hypothetical protein
MERVILSKAKNLVDRKILRFAQDDTKPLDLWRWQEIRLLPRTRNLPMHRAPYAERGCANTGSAFFRLETKRPP